MTNEGRTFDYIEEANVTASSNYHGDMVGFAHLMATVLNAVNAIKELDHIKKTLFYGRKLPDECGNAGLIDCTRVPSLIDEDEAKGEALLHAIVGIATEAGELLELLDNVLAGHQKFDDVNFAEEIGDGFWYAAIGLKAIGSNFGEVQYRNIAKLRHRFPQKFTEFDANNRDLFGERRILEMHKRGLTAQD